MTDKEHLQWIHDRLEHVHGENPRVDYMLRLKKIIDNLPEPNKNEDSCVRSSWGAYYQTLKRKL